VPVLTSPFRDVFKRHLKGWTVAGSLEPVVLAHPMQNISGEALEARAAELTEAILARLPAGS
jgi:hypothetical protein